MQTAQGTVHGAVKYIQRQLKRSTVGKAVTALALRCSILANRLETVSLLEIDEIRHAMTREMNTLIMLRKANSHGQLCQKCPDPENANLADVIFDDSTYRSATEAMWLIQHNLLEDSYFTGGGFHPIVNRDQYESCYVCIFCLNNKILAPDWVIPRLALFEELVSGSATCLPGIGADFRETKQLVAQYGMVIANPFAELEAREARVLKERKEEYVKRVGHRRRRV